MSKTTATEKPILFSAPMVRAIIEGRKTMTRRIMKALPSPDATNVFFWHGGSLPKESCEEEGCYASGRGWLRFVAPCPYGVPGDRLWVRESLRWHDNWIHYVADDTPVADIDPGPITRDFIPGIFMKRSYARLILEITEVRVERLQDMHHKAEEFEAEGIELPPSELYPNTNRASKLERHFAALWDSINGKGSWDANLWVWVVGFRRIDV